MRPSAPLLPTLLTPPTPSGQITALVASLREHSGDSVRFKVILRDFVVLLREHQGGDAAALFADEKEAAIEEQQAAERQRAVMIPGLLKVRFSFSFFFCPGESDGRC